MNVGAMYLPRISLPTVVARHQCFRECPSLDLLKSRCSTSHKPITEPITCIVPLLIRFTSTVLPEFHFEGIIL